MQGEGLYLAAPNDGYLLLYLSYLGFAWRGDDCVGAWTTPTYGGAMAYSANGGLTIPYI